MLDLIKINKIYSDFQNAKNSLNYYCEYNGGILSAILKGNIYLVENNNRDYGILILEKGLKEAYFLPRDNTVSIFKLFHLLQRTFKIEGVSIKIIYKKVNLIELKKYFHFSLSENMMYMYKDLSLRNSTSTTIPATDPDDNKDGLSFHALKHYKEEGVRIELQNSIFNNIPGRNHLTLEEVFEEYNSPKFMKNFCFLLEYYRTPVGYGQILKFEDQYMLVNFGILENFRKKGMATYFLNEIFRECRKKGLKELYLSVDKANDPAIQLYHKAGFREVYSKVTISFGQTLKGTKEGLLR